MRVISSPNKIRQALIKYKLKGKTIGFVPTMGALHQGHLSLIHQAVRDNDITVISIFVNPKQFGPKEDLNKYPRPEEKDLALCEKAGVDFVFHPKSKDMYPDNFTTYVSVEGLSQVLCGKSRPGHFAGVATVVTKLFNIIQPDIAYFGQKDAQQSIIIKKMVRDLNIPLKIKVLPTIREKDGLAMSSRNSYLNIAERKKARVLSQSLNLARILIQNGARDADRIINRMKALIKKKAAKIDYVELVDPDTLQPLKKISKDYFIVLAVKIGNTRLIDNFQGRCLN
ncbi:MAG: pantoate--beta-alanine ligase [Candidatus Omnitrophica bacterium]|nr:pantoate--beta-alanine ligase [Candidatus Omnitrophota bacterium]